MRTPVLQNEILKKLRDKILTGRYPDGYRLPTEPELARNLNVSRDCLRAALDKLSEERLIERIPRKGTFVTSSRGSNDKNIYYLLPCPDFMVKSGTMSAFGHMEAMSGALKATEKHGFCLIPVPVSTTNDENDIDFERLRILAPGSRILMSGISWFWKMFPLMNSLKCRVAGELSLSHMIPECIGYGWNVYVNDCNNTLDIILEKFCEAGVRKPMFVNYWCDDTMRKRALAKIAENGMNLSASTFLYHSGDTKQLRRKIAELFKGEAFDGLMLNFSEYHLLERESMNADLGILPDITIILADKFTYVSELEKAPAYLHFDRKNMCFNAVEWLVSDKPNELVTVAPTFFPAEAK